MWTAGFLIAAATAPAAQAQAPSIIRVQTTVALPSGGSVIIGSYATVSESRSEYGAPILRSVPYVNRPLANVGYGRSVSVGRVSASVRVIDLREEEERQTGYRRP